MNEICHIFSISRQAFYKHQKEMVRQFLEEQVIIGEVRNIRKRQPCVGTRKLQQMLLEKGFKIGRDKLFNILRKYKLLVKPNKNYAKTTDSYHRFRKYPNIIKDLEITEPNQVWVADITYLKTWQGFCYLALITDVYSRKIVGWDLSQSLSIEGSIRALEMALEGVIKMPERFIHHSDRGVQYCSKDYIGLLKRHDIEISMTEEDHCYENAIAERVNLTLKSEFLLGMHLASLEVAKEQVAQSIGIYNQERLHLSLDYQTPEHCYAN